MVSPDCWAARLVDLLEVYWVEMRVEMMAVWMAEKMAASSVDMKDARELLKVVVMVADLAKLTKVVKK